jgi:hypothetical protein
MKKRIILVTLASLLSAAVAIGFAAEPSTSETKPAKKTTKKKTKKKSHSSSNGSRSENCINPATGLPMVGGKCSGVDVGGNPYGMNNSMNGM